MVGNGNGNMLSRATGRKEILIALDRYQQRVRLLRLIATEMLLVFITLNCTACI